MPQPILISLSPNAQLSDVLLAARLLFQPWRWRQGPAVAALKHQLLDYFNYRFVWLLNAGRSALYLALKALDLDHQDEVICQAFTCVAVANAIKQAGARVVYVDTVKNGFNLDISDLKQKITPRTKAVIVQHTFGQADDLMPIKALCQKHRLTLIEDCAQALGARLGRQKVGSVGDLTVLSFGRDKVISSVFGGALLTNRSDLANKIDALFFQLPQPGLAWIAQQLLHPLIFALACPSYFWLQLGKFSLGKGLVFLARKLGLISLAVSKADKLGRPDLTVAKLPNALAALACHQWQRLDQFNQQRRRLAGFYHRQLQPFSNSIILPRFRQGNIYLRYSILVNKPRQLLQLAKRQQVMLGDWYRPAGFSADSCPHAQAVSEQVINLPTCPKKNLKDARRVVKLIKTYVNQTG